MIGNETVSDFLASNPLVSLVSYLASLQPVRAMSRPAGSTDFLAATEMPLAPKSASGPSTLSIATILGIVFSVMSAGGLVLGVLIWRYRKKRATQDVRDESEDWFMYCPANREGETNLRRKYGVRGITILWVVRCAVVWFAALAYESQILSTSSSD